MTPTCSAAPSAITTGRRATARKSPGRSVNPIPNITTPSNGTIAGRKAAIGSGTIKATAAASTAQSGNNVVRKTDNRMAALNRFEQVGDCQARNAAAAASPAMRPNTAAAISPEPPG